MTFLRVEFSLLIGSRDGVIAGACAAAGRDDLPALKVRCLALTWQ